MEAIRALQVARRGAVKARTAALNQLHGLIVSAPQELRDELGAQPAARLAAYCAALVIDDEHMADSVPATRAALRAICQRIQHLDGEIAEADKRLRPIVAKTAPRLSGLGVGPEGAGQLPATASDNPDRLRSEAALTHLCGVPPIPASRHRINRGGDRAANSALHTIVLCRMRYDTRTREYVDRRTKQGLGKKEIMRCLKRYVVREVHAALLADFKITNSARRS